MSTANKIPLSLYIHLPWCIRKCPYCDFNSHQASNNLDVLIPKYTAAIINELEHKFTYVDNRSIISIFFGGGTPSLFQAKYIQQILVAISDKVPLIKNCEITLEANPGAIDNQELYAYREAGINRISLGAQSFNNNNLTDLGRVHNNTDTLNALEIIKDADFSSFNIDIMYALNQQSAANAKEDLEMALSFKPAHLSWYQLTLEPNTVFYSKPPRNLPDEEQVANIEAIGLQTIHNHGLARYEISAFSKTHQQSQHNLNYWRYGDYLGVGAGAHSKITKDGLVTRIVNIKQPNSYLKLHNKIANLSTIAHQEVVFEFMLNHLRLIEPLKECLLTDRTGTNFSEIKRPLAKAIDLELICIDDDLLTVTSKGQRYLNDLTAIFLPVS